jgi:hypothetical protein
MRVSPSRFQAAVLTDQRVLTPDLGGISTITEAVADVVAARLRGR